MQKDVRKRGKRTTDYYDYNLLAVVILLTCFGLVMLYSTSAYEAQMLKDNDMYFFGKQAIISAGAILIAVVMSRCDYHLLIPVAGLAFMVSLILMAMVKFTPFGVEVNDSRRWLKLFGVQFQPSEIAKIAVIIYLPVVIIKMGRQVKTLKAVIFLLFLGILQGGAAFVLTDNLSTGLIIGGICVALIFVSHPNTKWFLIIGGGLFASIGIIVAIMNLTINTSDRFRIRRILAWLAPEANMSEGGYQVMQALYAIGSGGFFGKGLGNSAQKLGTIPEAQNDMIFPIICEELGIFGAVLLLLMFGYLLYRLFFIAQNAPDMYGTLLASGVFFHIAPQVILNVAVVSNLLPPTGITLPFVSYGGTSILFLMAEMGIALSVSRQIRFKDQEEGEEALS